MVWKQFITLRQEENEETKYYIIRYEQIETKMRNANMKIPDKVLAIHMMTKSSMGPQSKENVLTKTDLTNSEQMYNSMKKSMKEM